MYGCMAVIVKVSDVSLTQFHILFLALTLILLRNEERRTELLELR